MKHRIAIGLFLAVLMATATVPDFCGAVDLEAKIAVLREQIARQIELIKEAREKADASMTLAGIRVAEQLAKSEEELAAKVEMLQQMRDRLRDQIDLAREAMSGMTMDWAQMLSQAAAQIDAQIKQTNSVIDRMRQIRQTVDDEPETGSCSKNTGTNGASSSSILDLLPFKTEPTTKTDPVATAPQPATTVGPVAGQPSMSPAPSG